MTKITKSTPNILTRTKKLIPGTSVWHKEYRGGLIIEEWGTWKACRECYKPIPHGFCTIHPRSFVLKVGGNGIYDVLFSDGKTRSLNRMWLKLIP